MTHEEVKTLIRNNGVKVFLSPSRTGKETISQAAIITMIENNIDEIARIMEKNEAEEANLTPIES